MHSFAAYFSDMLTRQRVFVIYNDEGVVGWCSYFVGDYKDVQRFHDRPLFSVVEDAEDGPVIYIDYVASLCWNREIRETLYRFLKSRHPSMRTGIWYRPTTEADRKVVWEAQ